MSAREILCFWLTVCVASTAFAAPRNGVTEWLQPNPVVEFDSKEVPHIGLLNRLDWVEKSERSTSRNYTLWEEADVYLLEWPGNVTVFDSKAPLVKWGKNRAKYLEDPCGIEYTGIEMRVYAYKYVYLTWGQNRLTRTYTSPLTVPRSIMPGITLAKLSENYSFEENELNTITVYDIAFTFDTLLLAYANGVIRVSGLEMAWAEVSEVPKRKLKYAISQGITGPVDKIVVQSCCWKTEFCPFGNVVVAYLEHSLPFIIYISDNGGKSFQQIKPKFPPTGSLKVVLSYPEYSQLLAFHGNDTMITMNQINLSEDENLKMAPLAPIPFAVKGNLQGSRLGMDSSFIVWDNCSVWYSPDTGVSLTRSLLYIHKKIRNDKQNGLHLITSEHCSFGENSASTSGHSGKFALLDKENTLFLGIDGKNNLSQLVGLKMDMSLLIPGRELSVAPFIEYESEQPKLMYPPRYLELPKVIKLKKSYERRLGMRILPKNVYPSDYILSFYQENVKKQANVKNKFALKPCQTSSLKVNGSITQKRKLYYASPSTVLNFTVGFTSKTRRIFQLNFEPKKILKYLSVKIVPESIATTEVKRPQYYMTYRILIKSNSDIKITASKLFRLNFYTRQDLRCNYQPRVTVYIKLEDKLDTASHNYVDEDMTKSVYLKSVTAGETKYLHEGMSLGMGETFKVETCPFKQ